MSEKLSIAQHSQLRFFGTRFIGQQMRGEFEALLNKNQNVEIDFTDLKLRELMEFAGITKGSHTAA